MVHFLPFFALVMILVIFIVVLSYNMETLIDIFSFVMIPEFLPRGF